MNRAQFFKIVFSLFLSPVILFALYSSSWCMPTNYVSRIHFAKHSSFERVTVDFTHKPQYRTFRLKKPDRVVVDIHNCVLPQVHQKKDVQGRRISRIRASQHNKKTVRIILDLKEQSQPQISCLSARGTSSHCLILDLMPSHKKEKPATVQKSAQKEILLAARSYARDKADPLPEKKPCLPTESFLKQTEKKDPMLLSDTAPEENTSFGQTDVLPAKKPFCLGGFILAKGATDTKKETETEHRRAFRNKIRLEGKWTPAAKSIHELIGEKDKFYALASVESDYIWFGPNHCNDDYDLDLFEGYLYWSRGSAEIRLGKQIVRWGKTDQISPVDNVNSQDLREFIIPDLEDRKIPNWMARIRIFGDSYTLEGIYIPFFEPSDIDYFGTDWAVYQHLKEDVRDSGLPSALKDYLEERSVHESEPAKTFENGEWGARVSGTIAEWDMALSYLYAWEDLPYYRRFPIKNLKVDDASSFEGLPNSLMGASLTEEDIEVTYKRSHICGFEFETTVRNIGLRGEAAYFDRQSFLTNSLTSIRKPVFFYVLGADYSGENNWYINLQFAHQIISDYNDDILYFRRNNTSLNGQISKEFLRGNLETNLWYNYSLSDKGYYLRPRIICKYFRNLEITLGLNIFGGDADTLMGYYDDNDQVFLSFKYYF